MAREKTLYPPKITTPRTRNVLERERLFSLLDDARGDTPLLWVSAPGGSGKTTLLASYLKQRNLKSIWYQVDESDADPATFFHYLGLAGKKVAPRRKGELPQLTPEYLPGLATFTRRFFEELSSRLGVGGLIVLDNFQILEDNSTVAGLLEMMSQAIAGQVTIVVISRSHAPEQLAAMRVRGTLHEINVNDIRFTQQEWLAVPGDKTAKKAALLSLHKKMDGWIAGLLLCNDENFADIATQDNLNVVNEPLFNYFAVEFFQRLDDASQHLLVHCAFLDHFSEDSARSISGVDNAATILRALLKKNLFIQRQGVDSYTLHPLFQSYLQREAKQLLSKDSFNQLIIDSANTLVEQGDYEPAAELYIDLEAWHPLALLTTNHADHMYTQGRITTLQSWLTALPEVEKQRHTWLLFWEAALISFSDVALCLDKLDFVFEQFFANGDEQGTWRSWLMAVELMNKTWMESKRYSHWLKRHEQCRQLFGHTLPDELETQLIANLALGYMMSSSDPVGAEYWLDQLEHAVHKCTDKPSLALLLNAGLFICMVLGYLIKAKKYLAMLNELEGVEAMGPLMHLHVLANRMMGESFAGDPRRTIALYEESRQLTEQYGITIFEGIFQISGILSTLTIDEPERAKQHLKILDKVKDQAVMNTINYSWGKAQIAIYERRFDVAVEAATVAEQMTHDVGIPTYSLLTKLHLIEACREQGYNKKALSLLAEATDEADRLHMPLAQIRVHLLKARFAMDNNDIVETKQQLSALFKIAKQYDMHTYPGWVPGRLISWGCCTALEWGIETEFVQRYVRTLILWMIPPKAELTAWPWPIRISTLGEFNVAVNNVPINISAKRDSRPYRLLEALVELGGNCNLSQLIEHFYQQEVSSKIQQQFHTHIYRLRKLLGYEEAVLIQGERIKLNPKLCWIDADALEQSSQTYLKHTQAGQSESAWQNVLSLYHGEYLAHSNHTSEVIVRREHLRSLFLQTVYERLARGRDNDEQKIKLCQRVLGIEPLAEPLYRHLIKLYLKQERRDMAETVYAQCRRLLLAQLDIEPSDQTRLLLES